MTIFFKGKVEFQTIAAIVPTNGQTSTSIDCRGQGIVGIILPASLVSTTLTFMGSQDNVNFSNLYNAAGTALSTVVAANRIVLFTPGDLIGLHYIQLVTGSVETAGAIIYAITRTFT